MTCNSKVLLQRAGMIAAIAMLPATAIAEGCGAEMLVGKYVYNATGFTRPPSSGPGAPWVPKAILQIVSFNGDGTVTAPMVTLANPFGDTGNVLQLPAGGAPGAYVVNEDCTGKIHFFDAVGVMYTIYVEPPRGDTIWMIQTSPPNNVSQGAARRLP